MTSENESGLERRDAVVEAESYVMSEAEIIAVEIINTVPYSTEPKDDEEALEWEFIGPPIMASFEKLLEAATIRAKNDDQRREIFIALIKERTKRNHEKFEAIEVYFQKRHRRIFQALDEIYAKRNDEK